MVKLFFVSLPPSLRAKPSASWTALRLVHTATEKMPINDFTVKERFSFGGVEKCPFMNIEPTLIHIYIWSWIFMSNYFGIHSRED